MIFLLKPNLLYSYLELHHSIFLKKKNEKKKLQNKTNNGMTDKAKAKYNKRPAVTLIKIPITIKDIICPITINKDE